MPIRNASKKQNLLLDKVVAIKCFILIEDVENNKKILRIARFSNNSILIFCQLHNLIIWLLITYRHNYSISG